MPRTDNSYCMAHDHFIVGSIMKNTELFMNETLTYG